MTETKAAEERLTPLREKAEVERELSTLRKAATEEKKLREENIEALRSIGAEEERLLEQQAVIESLDEIFGDLDTRGLDYEDG